MFVFVRKQIDHSFISKNVWNLSSYSSYFSRDSLFANVENEKFGKIHLCQSSEMGREKPNYFFSFSFQFGFQDGLGL